MMFVCLILAGAAFLTVLGITPRVIRWARQWGALDVPDGFRKPHRTPTPRWGGLAVALGLLAALGVWKLACGATSIDRFTNLPCGGWGALSALILVLGVGLWDDWRGLRPSHKLTLEGLAATLLFIDGFKIERCFVFGVTVDLAWLAWPATLFWFLACMNIWNLIDGLDGLASGVGILVSVTLLWAAQVLGHPEVTVAAAALAGALAGFLVFNFHPARIFLGDSGSLLIGALLGALAIQGSLKGGMTAALLTPILAMGLPITDTALALFRRWLRHVPWSTGDRGHLHHRLLTLGLSHRQASLVLYGVTLLLCASALASVVLQSDSLAVLLAVLGVSGLAGVCLARRDEARRIVEDLRRRLQHRRCEQQAAQWAWEGIQRVRQAPSFDALLEITERLAARMGCDACKVVVMPARQPARRRSCLPAPRQDLRLARRLTLRIVDETPVGDRLELEFRQPGCSLIPLTIASPFLARFADELLARVAGLTPENPLPMESVLATGRRESPGSAASMVEALAPACGSGA